jgi:hypothetical protein
MLVCHTQLSFVTLLFSEVIVIFEDVVNSDNFVNVSVCPLHIEFFSFKQSNHIFLFCFDWKRGVDSVTACQNVLACELWVSASLEHYVPKWFSFSHNFKQSITIFFKSQYFILTFFPCVQPILSLAFHDLRLPTSENLCPFVLVVV